MNDAGFGYLPSLDYSTNPEQFLKKALDSTSASGTALIPALVDPAIVELANQFDPLRAFIPHTPWNSGTYDRNRRTALGDARFVGDNMSSPESNSTYTRNSLALKIIMAKGGVTGFLQAAGGSLTDPAKKEILGSTKSALYEEAYGFLYGNSSSNSYEWAGLEQYSEDGVGFNIVAGGNASFTYSMLDQAIDTIEALYAAGLGKQNARIVMSNRMMSRLGASLQSNGQRWLDKTTVDGGFLLGTYRDIPIIKSSFIRANQAWAGSTVTATAHTSGGAMADSAYYYKVAAVLRSGETLPATEATATISGGSNLGSVDLTWTAIAGARHYKIYRSTTTNTETYYTKIPGVIYTQDAWNQMTANPITKWVDTGSRTVMTLSTSATWTVTGANYAPNSTAASATNMPVLATDCEDVWLLTNEEQGSDGYVLECPTLKDMSYYPLAPYMDKQWWYVVQYATLYCAQPLQGRICRAKVS